MNATNLVERSLTELDFGRLNQLLLAKGAPQLGHLLAEAQVVEGPEDPADLVTMYANVEVEELPARRRRQFVLCYPGQAEPRDGHISVLSPVGLALIGLRAGATATWPTPSGEWRQARIVSVAHHSTQVKRSASPPALR